MYELVKAGERTYYIECPAKMGIYAAEDGAYLIDSGNDKEAGKKALKHISEQGWNLRAIINTHSNADHIGGNKLIVDRTGCPVYAKGIEAAFTRWPLLEPSFLFGGFPPRPLRSKFLMAQPSEAMDISRASLPEGMEIIDLSGHYFHMIGVKTPDDVWFLGDCVFGENIIDKYHLSFIYDVRGYLETLELISTLKGRMFIPAHAPALPDIEPLAAKNREKVLEICQVILTFCQEGICFEDLLQMVFSHYELTMDFAQYVLIGSTVKSFLAYLYDEGKAEAFFDNNKLYWRSI